MSNVQNKRDRQQEIIDNFKREHKLVDSDYVVSIFEKLTGKPVNNNKHLYEFLRDNGYTDNINGGLIWRSTYSDYNGSLTYFGESFKGFNFFTQYFIKSHSHRLFVFFYGEEAYSEYLEENNDEVVLADELFR